MNSFTHTDMDIVHPSFNELEDSTSDHRPTFASVVAQLLPILEWDPYTYRTQYFPTLSDRSTAYPGDSTSSEGPSNQHPQWNHDTTRTTTQTRASYEIEALIRRVQHVSLEEVPSQDQQDITCIIEALRERVNQVSLEDVPSQEDEYLTSMFVKLCRITSSWDSERGSKPTKGQDH